MNNNVFEEKIWLKQYGKIFNENLLITNDTGLDLFERAVDLYPNQDAFYYFDRSFTYKEIDELSSKLAIGLKELGVVQGDRVIVQLQNIPQYLIALYAIWKIGAIVVPLNPMYREHELKFYISDCDAKVFITMESCYDQVEKLLPLTPLEHIITTSELDYLGSQEIPSNLRGSAKINNLASIDLIGIIKDISFTEFKPPLLSIDDPGYLTYTSGTTGPPKGAINTHGNIVFGASIYHHACTFNNQDVVIGVAPFFHVTGAIGHLAIASMARVPVIGTFRFDAGELLRLIEKWKGSMMIAPLTAYIALLSHPNIHNTNLKSLRVLLSGGAPVPDGFIKKFENATGLYIHNWYGLTETTSPAIITPPGQKSPVDPQTGALAIGVPVPNTDVYIKDVFNSDILEIGSVGEIVIKGPMVVPGYWNKPEDDAKTFKNGYLHTGDVGMMDDEGWFYFVDRKKDLINVSGYKVWPREVEDYLFQHPAIQEACVIGVPDSYRGETVKAYIVLMSDYIGKISEQDLIDYCKEHMAAYKYPRIVEIVENIPQTYTGKKLKRLLRKNEEKGEQPDEKL